MYLRKLVGTRLQKVADSDIVKVMKANRQIGVELSGACEVLALFIAGLRDGMTGGCLLGGTVGV